MRALPIDEIAQYIVVPKEIIDRWREIGANGVALYLYLIHWRDRNGGRASPAYADIRRDTGWSEGRISETLRILEGAGFLQRRKRWDGSTVYSLTRPVGRFESLESGSSAHERGFVYLVHDGAGAYKIGHTKDLAKRIWDQIQPAYPRKLELIHAIETDEADALEAYWHERFADKRMNGEWFDLTEDDVKLFERSTYEPRENHPGQ